MAKTIAKTRGKKKKWYPVIAPKLFRETQIGESYVTDSDTLVGRKLSVNLMSITNDPKKQNISVQFKIKEIKEGKARTFATGYEMSHSSLKRHVRRGRDRLDNSFTARTKDGLTVRVKPVAVTTNNTTNSVLTRMRNTTQELVRKKFSSMHFNEILDSILSNEFQREMKNTLNPIYPVRNFEIRVLKLLDTDQEPKDISKPKAETKEDKPSKKGDQVKGKEESEEKKESEDKPKKSSAKKSKAKGKKEASEKLEPEEESDESKPSEDSKEDE